MTEKFTDRNFYERVIEVMADDAEVVAKAQAKLDALDAKAEKAKQKALEKASQPDELAEAILDVLSDQPMTIADVLAMINVPGATAGKVSNRLTKLKNAGKATKTSVTVTDDESTKSKKVAYTLPADAVQE